MRLDNKQKLSSQEANLGQLEARPESLKGETRSGLQVLGLSTERDGLLYVPQNYQPDRPAPLVLMLHGAGGNADRALTRFLPFANEAGLILLAPDSRRQTWDILFGEYGPDINFIDQALAYTFKHYAIDPKRIAIEGFSDGGSYALSVGITNGDLFTHVIAFSPGFMIPTRQQNYPRLFISHGTKDAVLPIDVCSRKIAQKVQLAGYNLLYREFDGPHIVPTEIAREAITWFTDAESKNIE